MTRVHLIHLASTLASGLASEAAACAPEIAASFQEGPEASPSPGAQAADLVVLLVPPYGSPGTYDPYALAYQIRERFPGAPVAAWVTDDPERFDDHYPLPALFDHVFTNDANARRYYHAENVHELPPAAIATGNTTAAAPLPLEWDLLLCGRGAAPGDDSLERAVRAALPPGNRLHVVERDADAPHHLCRRAKVVVRYPSRPVGGPGNELLGPAPSTPDARTFQMAEEGVFQVVFLRQPELLDFFAEDEIPTFSRAAELPGLLSRYLTSDEDRAAATARAQARVRREHLWRHRLQTLVRTVTGNPEVPA